MHTNIYMHIYMQVHMYNVKFLDCCTYPESVHQGMPQFNQSCVSPTMVPLDDFAVCIHAPTQQNIPRH